MYESFIFSLHRMHALLRLGPQALSARLKASVSEESSLGATSCTEALERPHFILLVMFSMEGDRLLWRLWLSLEATFPAVTSLGTIPMVPPRVRWWRFWAARKAKDMSFNDGEAFRPFLVHEMGNPVPGVGGSARASAHDPKS